MKSIFSKIIQGKAPADILYQDELVTAFRDIHPLAPTHILIVPNKAIPTVNDISEADEQIAGRMMRVAGEIARSQGIAKDGYRLIINCGRHGGQAIYHLHMHLLGGHPMGPMVI